MSETAAPPVASLVPHAGPMCLLDRVLDWDAERILCEASVADAHPLKAGGRLPATALIEYAAQAMAAHGRLLALAIATGGNGADDGKPTPGMLVGLRATDLSCRWVSHRRLAIEVRRLGGDVANILYGFEISGTDTPGTDMPGVDAGAAGQGVTLASGRAFVTLEQPR